MARDYNQELVRITKQPKRFAGAEDLDNGELTTILQQGVLLRNFRLVMRRVFSDEEVIRLEDRDILAGRVCVGTDKYMTTGVMQHLLPCALEYAPNQPTLNMLTDIFHISKAVKRDRISNISAEHLMIITGVSGELYRTVHGIRVELLHFYIVNNNALIIIDDNRKQFTVMSMQHILGNWIAGRPLSDHTSRTPSIVYMAHKNLRYKNIGSYLAAQDYSQMGKGDQIYIPSVDYEHGMYVSDQMTYREWQSIKAHYGFDIVLGNVMSVDKIKAHELQKSVALHALKSATNAVAIPIPKHTTAVSLTAI